jgi:hypothetical protein
MLALFFTLIEHLEQERDVGVFKVVGGLLDFVLVEHIAVGDLAQRTSAQTRS